MFLSEGVIVEIVKDKIKQSEAKLLEGDLIWIYGIENTKNKKIERTSPEITTLDPNYWETFRPRFRHVG